MNKLAIVILNWNGYEDTIECLESIVKNETDKFTVFLLDNGSSDGSLIYIEEWIKSNYKLKNIIVDDKEFNVMKSYNDFNLIFIRGEKNLGFAGGNNLVLNKVKYNYEYSLLLNNDTVITEDSISNMVRYLDDNKNTGALSCNIRLYRDKQMLWNAGGRFTLYGDRRYYTQNKIDRLIKQGKESLVTPFITGCVLMIRKEILLKHGVLSEKFFFGEEDFNYCKRLKNNNVLVESILTSIIYHKVGSSINKTGITNRSRCNSYVVHFSNRIINQKEFYNYGYWLVWRVFYMIAISIKIFKLTRSVSDAIDSIKRINHYSWNEDGIDYELFRKIREY
ncbi:glycosyltransferase [Clostridium putrefaciens]|uniref:Glycosyltransferase n=1 Tax=Clostridium putrefaciens TaxID=99675 RepID=A0A381J4D2_9CLOT|nr:glycosyltransferase family 2 protein [Clostridium putrefaciens]SUY45820.1 glycosyltransferase [Clostridium putrefaciens]